jgi:translocator protein
MFNSLIFKLIASLLLPLVIGITAGVFTSQSLSDWYETLNKPSFNPPNWLFGPVWTVLYLLMGVSLFLVWKQDTSTERNLAIFVFMIQLLLNFAWSFFFFHFHAIGLALIEIIGLWISIVILLVLFYNIKPLAAYINMPYFLWVTFAAVLNAAYYWLNRS